MKKSAYSLSKKAMLVVASFPLFFSSERKVDGCCLMKWDACFYETCDHSMSKWFYCTLYTLIGKCTYKGRYGIGIVIAEC